MDDLTGLKWTAREVSIGMKGKNGRPFEPKLDGQSLEHFWALKLDGPHSLEIPFTILTVHFDGIRRSSYFRTFVHYNFFFEMAVI